MFGPRRWVTRRNLMSFFLFMKKCLCRLRASCTPPALPLVACLLPRYRKKVFRSAHHVYLPARSLPGRNLFCQLPLFLSSKGYAETLCLFVERFTQMGIPAVLCRVKRLIYPSHQNQKCLMSGAIHDNSTTCYSVVPGGDRRRSARTLAK
ncbi:hypothetical protein MASSI9I_90431 [Massilia sp. 9I]|nr:hypothetical protein MASSI9I_90431 [Massilia sp. 9I]